MTETISSAVAKRDNGAEAQVRAYREDFATVLPSHIKPDTWIRVATGLLRRDEKLRAAAERNVGSFLAALLDCARLGLEPGETYHLVPFGGEIVGIEDYKGLIELIYRAGDVSAVKAEIVYEFDEYDYDPDTMSRPRHKPSALKTGRANWFAPREDRGRMVGAYCYCEMKSGGTSRVVQMAEWEIDEHKLVSKTWQRSDSTWKKWPRSAWLKTVVKEQTKWVPSSPEYVTHKARAERIDQEPNRELSEAARRLPAPAQDFVGELDNGPSHGPEGSLVSVNAPVYAEIVDRAEPPREDPPEPPRDDLVSHAAATQEAAKPAGEISATWRDAIAECVANTDQAGFMDLWESAKLTERDNDALAGALRVAGAQIKAAIAEVEAETAAPEPSDPGPEPVKGRRDLERQMFAILEKGGVRDADEGGTARRYLIYSRLTNRTPPITSTKALTDIELAQVNNVLGRYDREGRLVEELDTLGRAAE